MISLDSLLILLTTIRALLNTLTRNPFGTLPQTGIQCTIEESLYIAHKFWGSLYVLRFCLSNNPLVYIDKPTVCCRLDYGSLKDLCSLIMIQFYWHVVLPTSPDLPLWSVSLLAIYPIVFLWIRPWILDNIITYPVSFNIEFCLD